MARLPKCRAVSKWAAAALGVALLGALVASLWHCVFIMRTVGGEAWGASIGAGMLSFGYDAGAQPSLSGGWHVVVGRVESVEWRWMPRFSTLAARPAGVQGWTLAVPLYIPLILVAFATAWLFVGDRRSVRWAREGRCVGCGYDLSGVSGKCPECGR